MATFGVCDHRFFALVVEAERADALCLAPAHNRAAHRRSSAARMPLVPFGGCLRCGLNTFARLCSMPTLLTACCWERGAGMHLPGRWPLYGTPSFTLFCCFFSTCALSDMVVLGGS